MTSAFNTGIRNHVAVTRRGVSGTYRPHITGLCRYVDKIPASANVRVHSSCIRVDRRIQLV